MSRPKPNVINAIKKIPKSTRVLLAVSGGVDSIVLLNACLQVQRLLKLEIHVAHVDHNLRKDSKKDAKLVSEIAKQNNLKYHLKKAQKPASTNIEAWGRKLRYDFFSKLIKKHKLDLLITAHHAGDLAETLLMRVIANKELRGIQEFSQELKIFRPFLRIPKSELVNYAKQKKLIWHEDESNNSKDFFRNKVRLDLIPYLQKNFDPRIIEILAERQLELDSLYNSLAYAVKISLVEVESLPFGSRQWLKCFKNILQQSSSDFALRLISEYFIPRLSYRLGAKHAELLRQLLLGNTQAVLISGKIEYRRKNGGIQEIKL